MKNTYALLGPDFSKSAQPQGCINPKLIQFNQSLAVELDLPLENIEFLSGNQIPQGAQPLAMAYAGHQFGGFNPQLGDGRAILLGEVKSHSIQLKGAGKTFFSRNGDGYSALGPVLREYLVSEAMAKLGVPTTRALAAITSDNKVMREQLLPSGILTRIARSYIRVGTFQYFAAKGEQHNIKKLADYMIQQHFPELLKSKDCYLGFLKMVIDRQAALIAKWMHLGFIHGVMNTDNMSVIGETLDYGPCAFMDGFKADQVYSYIDQYGRYAYNQQANIGLWNLSRFAETLLPLLGDQKRAEAALNDYPRQYQNYWLTGMRHKLGLQCELNNDQTLITELFDIMASQQADFTLTFYYLSQLNQIPDQQDNQWLALFLDNKEATDWLIKWRKRLTQETHNKQPINNINPAYIPRNHQIAKVIKAAEQNQDFKPFKQLLKVLQNPYQIQEGWESYLSAPNPDEIVKQTFCGT